MTAYLALVPEHQFRRDEASLLCGKQVCLCPTGLKTPEVYAHMKQVSCSASDGKSSEPKVALTIVGELELSKLLSRQVDIYEVEESDEEPSYEVPVEPEDDEDGEEEDPGELPAL